MFGTDSNSKEAIYRAMVEQSLDALLVLEGPNLVDCNSAAERMYGASREVLTSLDSIVLSPPTQPDGRDSLMTARAYIALAQQGQPQRFEWQGRRFDGSLFPAEVSMSKLEEHGAIRTIVAIRDLSERKIKEEILLRQHARLNTVLDNFPGGICLSDEHHRIVASNQAWHDVLQMPTGQADCIQAVFSFIAEQAQHQIHTIDQNPSLATLLTRLDQQDPFSFEHTRPDGCTVEFRCSPVQNGGWVSSCFDVTATRIQQRAYKQQSLLLDTMVSHLPQAISVFDQDLRLQVWNQHLLEILDFTSEQVYQASTLGSSFA